MRRFLISLAVTLFAVQAFAQNGLIFSEYVEGSSNNKALEIYNGTGSPINIGSYRVRMFFNGSTSPGTTVTMAGTILPGETYVIVHNSAEPALRAKANLFSSASWYNGDDAIVLVDANGNVIDSIGQIGFDPGSQWGSGNTSTADNTLRRKAGVSTGDTDPFDVFDPAVEWDGFPINTYDGLGFHNATPPPPPPLTVAEIFEIQGSGSDSPYAGQLVETLDNIVTAVGHQGFFIQTPDYRADASSATSNGIYVFTGSAPAVSVGDLVDVKGNVVEFFGMTEFSGGVSFTIDAHNMPLPAYVDLAPGFSDFESLEGMLVRVTNGSAATGTDRFGETRIVAAAERPFRQPGVDGGHYPELLDVDPTGLGGSAPEIVGGATIDLAAGPLAFEFGDYSIWTTTLHYTNPPFPRPVRARGAGEMLIGAQNMFRLFDDRNDPSIGEPVTNPAVYAARLAAFSEHIRNVLGSPDVLAMSEVENLVTLEDLAARLNADEAGLGYTAYLLEGNDIGGIDVGFLVRSSVSVGSVAQLGANDTWIDPQTNAPALLNDRPPLLLRGAYNANGAPFPIAVIAVHQRSLIGIETSARVRAKREEQATRLASYIQSLYASDPDVRVVVTGDFNGFEFDDGYADVMGIVTANAGLTNQVLSVAANDRYSYVHEGVAQVLDHSLTSASLDPFVRALEFARANADAPAAAEAVSDHDGLVLFVMTDHDGDGYPDDADGCPTGDSRATVILGGCDSGAPNIAFGGGCTLADQINGLRGSAKNHGQFVASVGKLLDGLVKNGSLTGAQRGAIESCAARMK